MGIAKTIAGILQNYQIFSPKFSITQITHTELARSYLKGKDINIFYFHTSLTENKHNWNTKMAA